MTAAAPDQADLFGGHEFHYESHTDLFRCVRCHLYLVTVRENDGIKPCAGQPPGQCRADRGERMVTGGHGHVVPRPDGAKARCGGPALCSACAKELAAQHPAAATPGQAVPGDVVASLPRQWDAEADATAHWGDVSAPERSAYANGLRDCAGELRKALAARAALAAQDAQPAPGPAEERDRLALRLHAVRAILLDENASAGDARSRAAAAAYDEVLPQPAPGLRADAETCRLLRADLADAEAQLARWPRCPDGCGCRLGTEDAESRDCACDGPCCMECREMGYPDAPSYRDIAAPEPEAP